MGTVIDAREAIRKQRLDAIATQLQTLEYEYLMDGLIEQAVDTNNVIGHILDKHTEPCLQRMTDAEFNAVVAYDDRAMQKQAKTA